MSAYSLDLMDKIVESVKRGVPKAETALHFGVDRATAKRYCKQLSERVILEPRKAAGKAPKLDEKARRLLAEDLRECPWATHSQRPEFLVARCGVSVSEATICRTLRRLSHSRKRSLGARERDEFSRLLWREEVGRIDPSRLVFVDEMGTHTSLALIYSYAPVGERAYFETQRNRSKNTTMRASLHRGGMGHPWPWRGRPHPGSSRPTWSEC